MSISFGDPLSAGNLPLSTPCLGGGVPVAAACGACDLGFTLEMVMVVSVC